MPHDQSIAVLIVAVLASVLASLLAMAGLNRFWPREKRRAYNDLIAWQLSILGTTYAVILGFMLYAVWAKLEEAELNVDAEANAILDVYRLSDGLPEPQCTQLQRLARDYFEIVITQEWPEMVRGEVPSQNTAANQVMWSVVLSAKPASPTAVNAQEHATLELKSLEHRRLTQIRQSQSRLPNLLWCVLLVGGALTITCSCTLGNDSAKVQSLELFCLSLLLSSLCLVAIANIHRPFNGIVHVTNYAFQSASEVMQAH